MTFIPLDDFMIYYEDSERVIENCLAFIKELEKMTDLLPCPFCGGEAKLTELPLSQGWPLWFVRCQGCRLESPEQIEDDAAIRWWNTRITKTGGAVSTHFPPPGEVLTKEQVRQVEQYLKEKYKTEEENAEKN